MPDFAREGLVTKLPGKLPRLKLLRLPKNRRRLDQEPPTKLRLPAHPPNPSKKKDWIDRIWDTWLFRLR